MAALGGNSLTSVRQTSKTFMTVAEAYICYIDEVASGGAVDVGELHRLLSRLQIAGADLPPVSDNDLDDAADELKSTGFERAQRMRKALAKCLPIATYALVFNPLDEDARECILTTLDDDLADIYADLVDGIAFDAAGYYGDAVWHWRFLYYNHWGRHIVHAQSAVWQYLADTETLGHDQ